jgi:hypothetical protein
MLTLEKFQRKPEKFHIFTRLTSDESDTVWAGVEPVYSATRKMRRNHPCRQRVTGAGHPFTLSVAEHLLLVLIYWRVYLTQGLLGFLFELDDSCG